MVALSFLIWATNSGCSQIGEDVMIQGKIMEALVNYVPFQILKAS